MVSSSDLPSRSRPSVTLRAVGAFDLIDDAFEALTDDTLAIDFDEHVARQHARLPGGAVVDGRDDLDLHRFRVLVQLNADALEAAVEQRH
ncbi:MAG: hypothetical protein QM754_19490 [Tepidisphaeraceae bacterium]